MLTTCCDSIRRVFDTLPQNIFQTVTLLDLPHRPDDAAARLYGRELERLVKALDDRSGQTARGDAEPSFSREAAPAGEGGASSLGSVSSEEPSDPSINTHILSPSQRKKLLEAWKKAADENEAFAEKYPEGFLALMGARAGSRLFAQLESSLPFPVVDFTCGGKRHLPKPPVEAASLDDRELLTAYAKALLKQTPCMRMENIAARERLLKYPRLRGIVYHTVRFCDYYAFEYAALQKKSLLPILKLESDFTAQSEGQLRTRINAFAESLKLRSSRPKGAAPVPRGRQKASLQPPLPGNPRSLSNDPRDFSPRTSALRGLAGAFGDMDGAVRAQGAADVFIGIDSGSTTTNAAALGSDGRLLASCVLRTGPRAADAAANALTNVRTSLPPGMRIVRVFATGYGRDYIAFADGTRTEITCHGRGANYLNANARCVIDIGGQDSKVICLGEKGAVTNFVMNDKCAAGTGRFLEMMAQTLEMNLPELGRRGLSWKKEITISSVCTVFAESEVVSLIAQNNETDDIVHALNKAVASKTVSMARRVRGEGPFVMTGGVARNEGLVRELTRQLGENVIVPQNPDLAGAIGAALLAMEAEDSSPRPSD